MGTGTHADPVQPRGGLVAVGRARIELGTDPRRVARRKDLTVAW